MTAPPLDWWEEIQLSMFEKLVQAHPKELGDFDCAAWRKNPELFRRFREDLRKFAVRKKAERERDKRNAARATVNRRQ